MKFNPSILNYFMKYSLKVAVKCIHPLKVFEERCSQDFKSPCGHKKRIRAKFFIFCSTRQRTSHSPPVSYRLSPVTKLLQPVAHCFCFVRLHRLWGTWESGRFGWIYRRFLFPFFIIFLHSFLGIVQRDKILCF